MTGSDQKRDDMWRTSWACFWPVAVAILPVAAFGLASGNPAPLLAVAIFGLLIPIATAAAAWLTTGRPW